MKSSTDKATIAFGAVAKNCHGLVGTARLLLFRVDVERLARRTLKNTTCRSFLFFQDFLCKCQIAIKLSFPLRKNAIFRAVVVYIPKDRVETFLRTLLTNALDDIHHEVQISLSGRNFVMTGAVGQTQQRAVLVPLRLRFVFVSGSLKMNRIFQLSCLHHR